MYGDDFIQYVFNTGPMKDWVDVGPQIPIVPADPRLVAAFLEDTPPLWDLMAFTRTMAGEVDWAYASRLALDLVHDGLDELNSLLRKREDEAQAEKLKEKSSRNTRLKEKEYIKY